MVEWHVHNGVSGPPGKRDVGTMVWDTHKRKDW